MFPFRLRERKRQRGRFHKQKCPDSWREGADKICAPLIFPRHASRLELAPGRPERVRSRLPWLHRASPSATLHETVVSTDADKLIDSLSLVNSYFAFGRLNKRRWNAPAGPSISRGRLGISAQPERRLRGFVRQNCSRGRRRRRRCRRLPVNRQSAAPAHRI